MVSDAAREMAMRNYRDAQQRLRIEATYRDMYRYQTREYVAAMKARYRRFDRVRGIWDVMRDLDGIYDESDPDTELPQSVHAYQTAEALRTRFLHAVPPGGRLRLRPTAVRSLFSDAEWACLPAARRAQYGTTLDVLYADVGCADAIALIGFLHDAGKILLHSDFGALPQWSVVGDSFPVGAKLCEGALFARDNYHGENESLQEDAYPTGCGFDAMAFSWGHDEYMASVLERNGALLPPELVYLVRYHSFYPWHTPRQGAARGYARFASERDWRLLPLLKMFQSADLYSKAEPQIDSQVSAHYDRLIRTYLPSFAAMKW